MRKVTWGFLGALLLLLISAVAWLIGTWTPPVVHANGVAFQRGDVFSGAGIWIPHYRPSGPPKVDALSTGHGGTQAGMCFDPAGNLYATDYGSSIVSKFDSNGNLLDPSWAQASPPFVWPESCVADAAGNVYVGEAGGSLRKFDAHGIQQSLWTPIHQNRGVDWIDIAADQCTIFYTSEANSILRFNVCGGVQDLNFVDNLPALNPRCLALRIRTNGEVMVTCQDSIFRLDSTGHVILQTYHPDPSNDLFAFNLDPDGTSFWTGSFYDGQIYRVDIGSGQVLQQFTTDLSSGYQAGLAIFGEITAAQCQDNWCVHPSPNTTPTPNELAGLSFIGQNPLGVPTPPIAPTPYAVLNFWAAGDNNGHSLIEQRSIDGQSWSIVGNVPDVGSLYGVTSAKRSPDHWDSWAAGANGILHYDSSLPTPHWMVDSGSGAARAAAARTINDVWAVGTTIQHWDGTQWSPVSVPLPSGSTLTGVALFDAPGPGPSLSHDLRAVGYTGTAQNQDRRPLFVHKAASVWTSATDPSLTTDSYLNSIDVYADNYAWAVGSYYDTVSARYRALIEHWDGSAWNRVEGQSDDPGTTYNELRSVWIDGAGNVWAAGAYSNGSNALPDWKPLLLHWGDPGWQQVEPPNAGAGSQFQSIGTIPGQAAVLTSTWAVGSYQLDATSPAQTLIESIQAPPAPQHTTSYYETTLDLDPNSLYSHYEQGCAAATNRESGLIILDYGEPINLGSDVNPQYGTYLLGSGNRVPISSPILSAPDITTAAEQFTDGYHQCRPSNWTGSLVLALGINNTSNPANPGGADAQLTAGFAQAWANLVDSVYAHTWNYPEIQQVTGALDAEPNFAPPDPNNPSMRLFDSPPDNSTYTWVKNYIPKFAVPYYYNFGSTDGYPGPPSAVAPPGGCCSGWTAKQLYLISCCTGSRQVVPEIYKPPYASRWYRVREWSIETHQLLSLNFSGVMSECSAGGCTQLDPSVDPGGALTNFDFARDQAWQVFWLQLNSDPRTVLDLPWSTDIKWSDRPSVP